MYNFKLDEKVATPGGFAYYEGQAGGLVQVRTKKSTDKGEVRGFPVQQVLPALYAKFSPGDPVLTDGKPGRVVDVLYPKQLLAQSDYQLARKQTKLPKPISHCDGAYVGMWSYIIWFPHDPVNLHWHGAWDVRLGGDAPELPEGFSSFFETLALPPCTEGSLPVHPLTGEPPVVIDGDDPDNLNDLNIPGLSQGIPHNL